MYTPVVTRPVRLALPSLVTFLRHALSAVLTTNAPAPSYVSRRSTTLNVVLYLSKNCSHSQTYNRYCCRWKRIIDMHKQRIHCARMRFSAAVDARCLKF
jgi:hypothetical protein